MNMGENSSAGCLRSDVLRDFLTMALHHLEDLDAVVLVAVAALFLATFQEGTCCRLGQDEKD